MDHPIQPMRMSRGEYERLVSATSPHPSAYIDDALWHLGELRTTVDDGLTGPADVALKDSLLYDLEAAVVRLKKALS